MIVVVVLHLFQRLHVGRLDAGPEQLQLRQHGGLGPGLARGETKKSNPKKNRAGGSERACVRAYLIFENPGSARLKKKGIQAPCARPARAHARPPPTPPLSRQTQAAAREEEGHVPGSPARTL